MLKSTELLAHGLRDKHEIVNVEVKQLNGFACASFSEGEDYSDEHAEHHYILFVQKGGINIQMSHLNNEEMTISCGEMIFIPRNGSYIFTSLDETKVLFFAFAAPVMRKELKLFNYLSSRAFKGEELLPVLPMDENVKIFVDMVMMQLENDRIKNSEICRSWNNIFFVMLVTYYERKSVTSFIRPVLSKELDFKAFVENNYLQVNGNAVRLANLSGFTLKTFHRRFRQEFGMSAKEWLNERMCKRILQLASAEDSTVTSIAAEIGVSTERLCQLTRANFSCTPSALIEKRRASRS